MLSVPVGQRIGDFEPFSMLSVPVGQRIGDSEPFRVCDWLPDR